MNNDTPESWGPPTGQVRLPPPESLNDSQLSDLTQYTGKRLLKRSAEMNSLMHRLAVALDVVDPLDVGSWSNGTKSYTDVVDRVVDRLTAASRREAALLAATVGPDDFIATCPYATKGFGVPLIGQHGTNTCGQSCHDEPCTTSGPPAISEFPDLWKRMVETIGEQYAELAISYRTDDPDELRLLDWYATRDTTADDE